MREEVEDLEWEEWDGKSPFIHHCIAGSIAGVTEHSLLYPIDTIKTHMQSYCADCPKSAKFSTNFKPTENAATISRPPTQLPGMWRTFHDIVRNGGHRNAATPRQMMSIALPSASLVQRNNNWNYLRLWRGVQTMVVGCIPAHALYFSSYEAVKHSTGDSSSAGAVATLFHDVIMTPLDTVKQRLQLGHYNGFITAIRHMYFSEGPKSFYRSYPITLFTNLPYGVIMVTANDNLKRTLQPHETRHYKVSTCLLSGSVAGALAAAATTPLDRIKTKLQTQAAASLPRDCADWPCTKTAAVTLRYDGIRDALRSILKEDGGRGLFRGLVPRLVTHTPAVAISWTAYEMVKKWLAGL